MSEQDFWQIAVIVWAGSVIWLLNDIRQTTRYTHKLVAHHVTRRWPQTLATATNDVTTPSNRTYAR